MSFLTKKSSWIALREYRDQNPALHIGDLFAQDPGRGQRYSGSFENLYLDYSKNRIDDRGMALLMALARDCDVERSIQRMFSGERINVTENRAVLHTALRNGGDRAVLVDGKDVMPQVRDVLARLEAVSDAVREGHWLGYTGKAISDIVNIGIGGSHLGPQMVTAALAAYARPGLRTHFVANIDGTDIVRTLRTLDAETTLFIVASKTFTTLETMTNARSARDWFLQQGGTQGDIAKHFVAVSTNAAEVGAFGIDTRNMYEFWDWVGGRYSLWSAIGLPIALSVGFARFSELLSGAHAMDEHFRQTPLEQNWPVVLAMLGIWNGSFLGARSHAIVPYSEYLRWLPDYLQQADMESNGKHVTVAGEIVDYPTGPIIWGSTGTNGQHAYFQLLHQGTHLVPADFIAVVNPPDPIGHHHELLLANCLAQSEALMLGRDLAGTTAAMLASGEAGEQVARLAPHRVFEGNRPSNTLLLRRLDPRSLGSLLALYEHKIFVQGLIWQINSFDQWGVELGKQMATDLQPELTHGPAPGRNASTAGLIDYCRRASDKTR